MDEATPSQKLGAFVESMRGDTVSPEVIHEAARVFVDTFAAAAAGSIEPSARIVRDHVTEGGQGGAATLWATGERVRPEDAALANGTAGHVLDYDDVTPIPLRGHPSVVLMPALVALGERIGATGAQISAAYAVGFDVFVKIPQSMVWGHVARGWHTTPTLGVVAGAAACANLLGLNGERAVAAVGIATSHVSGLKQGFGTMCKGLHPGMAAASAIRCASLAARGLTAPREPLANPLGFMSVYGGGEDLQAAFDDLGNEPLEMFRTGIEVKKYPCCRATHSAIQGLLDMIAEQPIPVAEVRRVRVRMQARGMDALVYHRPRLGLEAKFSMEYVAAAALLDGTVGLRSFSDAAVQRPEAQALISRVDASEDKGEPGERRWTTVEVDLTNGEKRSIRVDRIRGGAGNPLPDVELEEKLRDAVAHAGIRMDVDRFLASVWDWRDRPIGSITGFVRNDCGVRTEYE